jgi:TonB family protein
MLCDDDLDQAYDHIGDKYGIFAPNYKDLRIGRDINAVYALSLSVLSIFDPEIFDAVLAIEEKKLHESDAERRLALSRAVQSNLFGAYKTNDEFNGTYVLEDQQGSKNPTDFFKLSNGSFTAHGWRDVITQGKYSITGDRIEFVRSDGKVYSFQFSRTKNAIKLSVGNADRSFVRLTNEQIAAIEEVRKTEETRKAEEALKSAGFFAPSESLMTWADAKAYCASKGGRLPLINNSDSWEIESRTVKNMDGFAYNQWPSGLPHDTFGASFWTGTEVTNNPGKVWTFSAITNGRKMIGTGKSNIERRVVCVSPDDIGKLADESTAVAKEQKLAVPPKNLTPPSVDILEKIQKDAGQNIIDLLSGVYVTSVQKGNKSPTYFLMLSDGSYTASDRRDIAQGRYSIKDDRIVFFKGSTHNAMQFSRTQNEIKLSGDKDTTLFVRATNNQIAAIESDIAEYMRKKEKAQKSAGFIAVSMEHMTLDDAKAFCQQRGGRLPRINNSDKLAVDAMRDGAITHIDGIGAHNPPQLTRWPSSLPRGRYWTATECLESPDSSWFIDEHSGNVSVGIVSKHILPNQVFCVPLKEQKTTSENRAPALTIFGGLGGSDGPAGRGGDGVDAMGDYLQVIHSQVRANWPFPGQADRRQFSTLVNLQIAPDGAITQIRMIRSSGNAFYDSSVQNALVRTARLEPPPRPDLMNLDIEFAF